MTFEWGEAKKGSPLVRASSGMLRLTFFTILASENVFCSLLTRPKAVKRFASLFMTQQHASRCPSRRVTIRLSFQLERMPSIPSPKAWKIEADGRWDFHLKFRTASQPGNHTAAMSKVSLRVIYNGKPGSSWSFCIFCWRPRCFIKKKASCALTTLEELFGAESKLHFKNSFQGAAWLVQLITNSLGPHPHPVMAGHSFSLLPGS